MKRLFSAATLLLSLLASSDRAVAGPILSPVNFSVSSPDPFNPTQAQNNIVDQSGLSANYISGVTDFDTFVASTTASFSGGASSAQLGGAGPPPSFFQFDFGGPVTLDGIAIWNQAGTASLDTFTIETSLVSDFSVSQTFGPFQMSIFGGANPIAADVFSFAPTNLQYLRVNNLTNAGFPSATRLNEFAFRSTDAAVPEPFTLATFGLMGVAGAGYVRRRMKAAPAA